MVLLVSTAIATMIAIEYTYSSSYAKQVPHRMQRMYARGLAYAFLACLGVLLIVVVYAIATEGSRRDCRPTKLPPATTQASDGAPMVSVRVGDEGPFTNVQQAEI